jgi:hypothetical protein
MTWNYQPMVSGASGGFLVSYSVNLTPGEVISITVGVGAPVWTSSGIHGGGTTTFGSYLSCTGGGRSSVGVGAPWADPGNCGAAGGAGNFGQYVANSAGAITGGNTSLVYGNGGMAERCDNATNGCASPNYAYGTPGNPGVVIVDVLY